MNIVEILHAGRGGFIFNVKEKRQNIRRPFGGTTPARRTLRRGLNQYLRSIDHYLEFAKKMKMSRFKTMRYSTTRRAGLRNSDPKTRRPNPLLMPIDKYTRRRV